MERAEKIGLGVATAGHVLLFALLSAGFLAAPNPLKLNPAPMDVSLVDEVALKSTAPKISTEPPPPSEAPEKGPTEDAAPAPVPEPAPKPTPVPPAPKAKPVPEPEETPAPPKPTPAPPKKVAVKPVPKAKPAPATPAKAKPSPQKPRPAAAAPAAPKAKAAPKADAPAKAGGQGKADKPKGSRLGSDFLKGIDSDADTPRKAPAAQPAAVLGPQQKAALNAEISRQLKPYWKAPTGADADQLVTILRWRLNRDGTLADGPGVVDQTGVTPSNRPQAALHQENAMKAVRAAAPFRLPPEYYDTWKNIVSFRFDKRL